MPDPARSARVRGKPGSAARVLYAALAAVLLAGLGCWWWATREGPSGSSGGFGPLLGRSVVTVAPGVHLLGLTHPNAAYAVETSEGLVLVDTCKEADAGPVIRQVRSLGLYIRRLRLILLTHAHGDHSLGAESLRRSTGAKVHAGRGDCAVLRAGGPREAFFSVFDMPGEAHPTEVDVELEGGEVIELGEARFRVVAAPGHTPGSVCYLLERGGLRILFTGDVLMSLTDATLRSGPGIYTAYLSPRYRGSAGDSMATLRKLLEMPVPDLVLPGHPAADPLPEDPRVPPWLWKSLLTKAVASMETLTARHEQDGADFLDGTAKQLLPGLHYFGDYGGCAVYVLVTPSNRWFLFDAPGGPGLPAFLAGRCRAAGLGPAKPAAVLLTSDGPEATAGLGSLVEATQCTVVAPRAALDGLRVLCPPGARRPCTASPPRGSRAPRSPPVRPR